jgi:hypothetical protein
MYDDMKDGKKEMRGPFQFQSTFLFILKKTFSTNITKTGFFFYMFARLAKINICSY